MIVKADVKRKVITFSANFSFDLKREVAWPGQMNLDLNHNAAVTMQCNIMIRFQFPWNVPHSNVNLTGFYGNVHSNFEFDI